MSISSTEVYKSVREEILDQKRCQFQMFAASVTFSSGVFAYSGTGHSIPVVLIAPIVLNVLALFMILDKAKSIQRMVGYLQLMENDPEKTWKWEYHLNKFRELPAKPGVPEHHRKHKYIRNIAIILSSLNIILAMLYVSKTYGDQINIANLINHLTVLFLNMIGVIIAYYRFNEFVKGGYTTNAIISRWDYVVREFP